jgi:hypothetical protein
MQNWRQWLRWSLLALVMAAGLASTGCKTESDPSNEAVRPWNAPKGWETGLPSGMWEKK